MLRFGTDGVRGDAETDLTDDLIRALGRAAARVLGADRFVVGRDTRESGRRIEEALLAGLSEAGADVTSLGVMPTPGVAYFAQQDDSAAAVISASHNEWTDNGVKLLAVGGRKLADDVEDAIERELDATHGDSTQERFVAWSHAEHRAAEYVEHLAAALEGRTLDGMRVVLDCANGAAHQVGPAAFRALGADVVVLNAEPDGRNINANCGSTSPERLQAAVRGNGADLGLALDGDADRVIAADERGELVDGDQIMTALAVDLHTRGKLRNDAIAVTVMSNLGLRKALAAAGIAVVETQVGDRNVLVALEEHGLALGGEQSGHIILRDLATTGDGVLTGLVLCDLLGRTGAPLSLVAGRMERFPQVLINVPVDRLADLEGATDLRTTITTIEATLGDRGRVLVRASGTEPLVRVMVEAPTEDEAQAAVTTLRRAVEAAFAR